MLLDSTLQEGNWRTCFALLPKVSRTFALSISLLKPPMRQSVCLAYLLCRLVDTFEDAPTLSTEQKAAFIRDLQAFLTKRAQPDPDWPRSAVMTLADGVSPSDRELLEETHALLDALDTLPAREREAVVRCCQEMATGMIEMQVLLDAGPGPRALRLLPSMESLTRYCHYVAGIVGTLLTELFYLNSDALGKERFFDLLNRAESFGQYLQKINILKDIPHDHAKGWCFIPRAIIPAGIAPEALLEADPARRVGAIAPVMREVLDHLAQAWQYLSLIPVQEREYRLFLGYSLFFGAKTLELGLKEPDRSFSAERPLKIGRLDVAAVIAKVNALIDEPSRLGAYMEGILDSARRGLDPRWPASIPATLDRLLSSLDPPAPARP